MKNTQYTLNKNAVTAIIMLSRMSTDSIKELSPESTELERIDIKKLAEADELFMRMIVICFNEKPFTIEELRAKIIYFWYKYEANNYSEEYTEKVIKSLDSTIKRGLECDYFLEKKEVI